MWKETINLTFRLPWLFPLILYDTKLLLACIYRKNKVLVKTDIVARDGNVRSKTSAGTLEQSMGARNRGRNRFVVPARQAT